MSTSRPSEGFGSSAEVQSDRLIHWPTKVSDSVSRDARIPVPFSSDDDDDELDGVDQVEGTPNLIFADNKDTSALHKFASRSRLIDLSSMSRATVSVPHDPGHGVVGDMTATSPVQGRTD